MTDLPPICCADEERRAAVWSAADWTGIDSIEVSTASVDDNRFLAVHLLNPPAGFTDDMAGHPERVDITGGVRITGIRVLSIEKHGTEADVLVVECDQAGDYSTYTLTLTGNAKLDPVYSSAPFSFKASCPSSFDCATEVDCPDDPLPAPPIDYLAKDYASFRRALFDLLPSLLPDWTERLEADLGTALVELMAYAGDQLSYYQDAVANEAYLETARQRISVRRHARLVDYPMHDGASSRALVFLEVEAGGGSVPAETVFLTRVEDDLEGTSGPHGANLDDAVAAAASAKANAAFESLTATDVHADLNKLQLHTWGSRECYLPKGATGADLVGDWTHLLSVGDLLLFEERLGAQTGLDGDADPTHRQVVRLTGVSLTEDALLPETLTRVAWADDDALTFSLCVATYIASGSRAGEYDAEVGVARGNIVLVDHGRTIAGEVHEGRRESTHPIQDRAFRLVLDEGPLSMRLPLTDARGPVADLFALVVSDAEPEVRRVVVFEPHPADPLDPSKAMGEEDWIARRHLLDSSEDQRHVVPEVRSDGRGLLRFGDGRFGREPEIGANFAVTYRVGVGTAGNVGAGAIAHAVGSSLPKLVTVRNPLPAWGGTDPEPIERVKRLAPKAFRADQLRAVTEADYAEVLERRSDVTKAVATYRWTGSWSTVFIAVDPVDGVAVDAEFEAELVSYLERFRLTGYDVEITPPVYVPLEIEIDVCVSSDYFRGEVEEALYERLSSSVRSDGSVGFFHPDRLTFDQPIWLSALYEAVSDVEGVDSASVKVFQRYGQVAAGELKNGVIPIGRLEIAQLANSASDPESGVLKLHMWGGK
ncbi:MAG: baseplate J/gp47 family protein [Planctomycetota bacterium]